VTAAELESFFVVGYLTTVLIEACVLVPGLAGSVPIRERLLFSALLTAFTYPFVVIVFPLWLNSHGRLVTLIVAETFAPMAEVFLLRFAINQPLRSRLDRNAVAVITANVVSFGVGELFLSEQLLALARWLLM